MQNDNTKEIMQAFDAWTRGDRQMFIARIYYGDKNFGHGGCDILLYPESDIDRPAKAVAIEKAVSHLKETSSNITYPEWVTVLRADKEKYPELVKMIKENTVMHAEDLEGIAVEIFLNNEEALAPVDVRFPEYDEKNEELYRSMLLNAIHSLVEEISARTGIYGPFEIGMFPKGIIKNVLPFISSLAKIANGNTATDIGAVHTSALATGHLKKLYECLREIFRQLFMKEIAVNEDRKVFVPEKKKKFRVAIHWDVAYCLDVEAANEEEAVEIARIAGRKASSSDWEWLAEDNVSVKEKED